MAVIFSGYTYLDSHNWDNSDTAGFTTIQLKAEAQLVVNTGVSGLAPVVPIGDDAPGQKPTEITIGGMGGLYGEGWGIALAGSSSVRILNNGVIHGEANGVGTYDLFGQIHGTFTSLINNGIISSGTLDSNNAAIRTNAVAGQSTSIVNTGTIVSGFGEDGYAIHHTGESNDRILNTGNIVGIIDLGAGNDSYDGRKGVLAGVIYGGDGNDTIRTGSDDDILNGGLGTDTLYGGAGDDSYVLGDDTTDVIKDTSGTDKITSSIGRDLNDYNGIDNATITAFGKGNLIGTDADNNLIGSYAANTLTGGDGNDILSGNKGNDVLLGGNGKDVLTGGTGADLLTGGAGSDIFSFLYSDNSKITTKAVDTITDWSTADSIDIKIAGTSGNYYEHSVSASVDTIEEAAAWVNTDFASSATNVFLYNTTKDIGFLLMDFNNDDKFETGVILAHSGKATDFSYADLI